MIQQSFFASGNPGVAPVHFCFHRGRCGMHEKNLTISSAPPDFLCYKQMCISGGGERSRSFGPTAGWHLARLGSSVGDLMYIFSWATEDLAWSCSRDQAPFRVMIPRRDQNEETGNRCLCDANLALCTSWRCVAFVVFIKKTKWKQPSLALSFCTVFCPWAWEWGEK